MNGCPGNIVALIRGFLCSCIIFISDQFQILQGCSGRGMNYLEEELQFFKVLFHISCVWG